MDVVTGVELECSYGAGDGQTRSGVASMPKERSGRPRLDRSCDWEKYGYDRRCQVRVYSGRGSSQVRMKADKGQRQGAGQEVSLARVGDRLDSTTKDNEC